MFDIGGFELLLIAVVALLILGPERLPEALRTLGLWLGRLRRSFVSVKTEIEKEIGMDEVKRQLHNEAVMAEMKRIEAEVQGTVDEARIDPGIAGVSAGDDTDAETAPSEQASPAAASATDVGEEPEPPKARPRTEAEVEAAYERKMRAQQANSKDAG